MTASLGSIPSEGSLFMERFGRRLASEYLEIRPARFRDPWRGTRKYVGEFALVRDIPTDGDPGSAQILDRSHPRADDPLIMPSKISLICVQPSIPTASIVSRYDE